MTTKSSGRWCFEGTCTQRRPGDHDCDKKCGPKAGGTDDRVRDRGVDGPHVSTESAGEDYNREILDEGVQRLLLRPIAFPLAISTMLDHRPLRIAQV